MKQFCIVMPVYKDKLDCIEELSLDRLNKVIGKKNYDVFLVCPEGLDTKEYYKHFANLKEERFNANYFRSLGSYSQLCISYDFYNRFSDYEYMLICQLDCYLVKDNIKEWCNKNYDYVGGPIISTDCGWDTVKKSQKKYQPYVGNGGFSLRKIETFKDICDPNGELRTKYNLTDEILGRVGVEDKYFCNDLFDVYDLDIPDWKTAMDFGLDMSVDVIYTFFNIDAKPMGIHAWDKNIRWWRSRLPELKNRKDIWDYCEKKHEELFKLYYDENNSTLRK